MLKMVLAFFSLGALIIRTAEVTLLRTIDFAKLSAFCKYGNFTTRYLSESSAL